MERPLLLWHPCSAGAPGHTLSTHTSRWSACREAVDQKTAGSPGTRKPQAGFPWTQQDPSEAAWPVIPSTWSPSSSLPWMHGPGKKAACGTSVTPTLLWDSSACCASQTELAEAGKGAASPAAGFLYFKQHMQIKLARVPLHLRSSSAALPNNSQAKLTQFEIKIKFIFRGIYFPYPSVSVNAFSVWSDKHTSTLSPDPLNPSGSHLTDKGLAETSSCIFRWRRWAPQPVLLKRVCICWVPFSPPVYQS